MTAKKALRATGILIGLLLAGVIGFVWFGTYHPRAVEEAQVTCSASAPQLPAGATLKVLTWNVQTMSGKNHVFWNDLPGGDGPDEKPAPEEITQTFAEVARVIRDEDPDLVLLQELDHGAERTGYDDQLARLLDLMPESYPCVAATFDWKAAYVPHPRIHGSVGWVVAVLSKYQISEAQRLALVTAPGSWIEQPFRIKPAILAARLPIAGGGVFVASTLHLDVYVPGTDAKDRQVKQVRDFLDRLDAQDNAWVLGGDFNLLPYDDASYQRLIPSHRASYNPRSEIKPLYDSYQAVPGREEVTGADFAAWLTRFPNDPAIMGPDRILDYLFFPSRVSIGQHRVRQADTLGISDHLPVIATFTLP